MQNNQYCKTPEILKPYLTGGNATFTLLSKKLNKRYTYNITQDKKVKNRYLVSLFYGSDNTDIKGSYRFLGLFYTDTMQLKVNSIGDAKRDAGRMLEYFLEVIVNKRPWPETCEFYPSCHCARCGRKLTNPESIKKGIGPDCLEALGYSGENWGLDLER